MANDLIIIKKEKLKEFLKFIHNPVLEEDVFELIEAYSNKEKALEKDSNYSNGNDMQLRRQ